MTRFALAIVFVAAILGSTEGRAQSLNQAGVARLNADVQALWAIDGVPLARAQGLAELQKLVGQTHNVANICDATIVQVSSLTLDAPVAPGVTRLDGSRIEAALPLAGTWRVVAEVRVHCHGSIFGIDWYDDFNVGVELRDLAVGAKVDLDSSDPTAPKLVRVHPPTLNYNLKVTSTSDVVQFLGWLTSGTVNGVSKAVATVGLDYLVKKLDLTQYTPQVVGEGSALAPVQPADLERAAVRLEHELVTIKMPFGGCVEGKFDRDYLGTWEDSLNDPSFNPGTLDLVAVDTAGDEALMTGYYLGALSFRYAATRSPEALAHAKQALAAYRILLTMRGAPGDLNRSITPFHGQPLDAQDGDYADTFQGKQYVMSGYVSRDAYTGTLFGLSLAHDLLDDPRAKAEAAALLEMALDYLLANHWTHRKHDGSFDERWQGAIEEQYAWVNAAYRCDPVKYAAVMDQYKGYSDILWTGIWLACLDPYYSYFKFALGSACLHTALRTETDPVRWQRTYQGMAILRHFVGHHQNAHFNNFYLAADPSSVARLGAENKNLLTRWLRQPRRYVVHDLRSDPTIEKVDYTPPYNTSLLFPGQNVPQTVQVAKVPLPVEKRISTSMRWDRSPYSLHEDYLWGVEARHEGESIDFLTPYWMARYYHAIAGPPVRHPPVATAVSAAAQAAAVQ